MPNIDLSFAQDPNTLALAMIYGMLPAVAWLIFWLRETSGRPRKSGVLSGLFFGGVAMVIVALPVEKFVSTLSSQPSTLTILWAASEEILKFGVLAFFLYRGSKYIEAPVDYALYATIVALGFAGFENALYFLEPLQTSSTGVLILAGTMRFLGTTLMHAVATSLTGIALGFAYFKSKKIKIRAALIGLAAAICLHSTFNLLITQNDGRNFITIFGLLWIATIIILALFERTRRMGGEAYRVVEKSSEYAALEARLADKTIPFPESLAALRAKYAEFLVSQGALAPAAGETALKLIPDTIPPEAVAAILATLKQHEGI